MDFKPVSGYVKKRKLRCIAYTPYAVCALLFVPQASEKYYDLCGALGFISTTYVSLYYPALKDKYYLGKPGPLPRIGSFAPRQLLISGCIALWSTRLGYFLASVCVISSPFPSDTNAL